MTESRHVIPAVPSEDPWETAYLRFESPQQEIAKFSKRLRKLGANQWPRESEIVELFCGRGNGLHALRRLGFTHIEGADLSSSLLAQYQGDAACHVCDCRQLPFADRSKDILIVQGGLHHLPALPGDLELVLTEMHRVLRPDGRAVFVEPWLTSFLKAAHLLCEKQLARRFSNKVDALATMIEYERRTYEQWLTQPQLILKLTYARFSPHQEFFAWGKWNFVGLPV